MSDELQLNCFEYVVLGGSVPYIPHLSKEIMVKAEAKKEVERKNLKLSHGRGSGIGSCPAERGKDGKYPKGMYWWECTAARGEWGEFVASVT